MLYKVVKLTIPQNSIRKGEDGSKIWSGLIGIDGKNHKITIDMSSRTRNVRFQGPLYQGKFPIKEFSEYPDVGLKHKQGDYCLRFEYEEPDFREKINRMAEKAKEDKYQKTLF